MEANDLSAHSCVASVVVVLVAEIVFDVQAARSLLVLLNVGHPGSYPVPVGLNGLPLLASL